MPIEFRCIQCQRLLRTPDDTAGQQAKCPECGAVMTIPTPGAAPQAPSPPLPTPPVPGGPSEPWPSAVGTPRGERAGAEGPHVPPGAYFGPALPPEYTHAYAIERVAAPATALTVLGGIGLVFFGLSFVAHLILAAVGVHPAVFQFPGLAPEVVEASNIISALMGLVFAGIVFLGGLRMKSLRNYPLAMSAAIIAIIPCFWPCCLFGIPIGIWSLTVLSDRIVRGAFQP